MKSGALIAALGLLAVAGSAQNPVLTRWDTARQVKLSGPVIKIDWTNPKAYIFVNVRDATGTLAHWAVEIGNPLDLEKDGWRWDSVHIGDVVNVEGFPARDVSREVLAKSVSLSGGRKVLAASNKKPATAAA